MIGMDELIEERGRLRRECRIRADWFTSLKTIVQATVKTDEGNQFVRESVTKAVENCEWAIEDQDWADDLDAALTRLTESDAEVERLREFIAQMASAPDSQVSSFVRAACGAVLDGGTGNLPPGDPYKVIAELQSQVEELKKQVP